MVSLCLFYCYEEVYEQKYMDGWDKFNETSGLEKKDFYIHLNTENITDLNYTHAKKDCKDFKIKNLGQYHDLYVQSYTLLPADVFENFRNKCLEKYELDSGRFFTAPGLA